MEEGENGCVRPRTEPGLAGSFSPCDLTLDNNSGREAFVHFSDIQAKGYRKLTEGDVVEFDAIKGDKGLKAENVVVLEHAGQ